MQFRHPEILYFLFLLVIPVLVHLFQLRRFKKQEFTNVRILQELSIQTRKSSKIKKWLLLATRLLLLAAAVIAFAQPFTPALQKGDSRELFVVLDNSYSMQAKGPKGELLRRAVEDLLLHMPENQSFSLLTADETFWNTDIKSIRQDLQNLTYSPVPFQADAALAKIRSRKSAADKDVLLITDAAGAQSKPSAMPENVKVLIHVPEAVKKANVSVDSVYLKQTLDNFYEIGAKLSAQGETGSVQVALYDGGKLIAKTQTNPSTASEIKFTIPKQDFNGWLSVTDNGLEYDNTYYFTLSKPKQSSVLVVGDVAASAYLGRIYTQPEFEFQAVPLSGLDYNSAEKQDVIILNELREIPAALQSTLKAFVEKGGNLVVIPSMAANLQQLNALAGLYGMRYEPSGAPKKQVTRISFGHPLYRNVFEKSVDNFQYPEIRQSLKLSTSSPTALAFDDGTPFLASSSIQAGTVYFFAAPLNKTDGNFQNTPLIVPTFYNMAGSAGTGVVAHTIGTRQPVIIDAPTAGDEVLSISLEGKTYIPEQRQLGRKVQLNFGDFPTVAGNYDLKNKAQYISNISFNYPRTESNLTPNTSAYGDFESVSSIGQLFDQWQISRTDTGQWKWFVILALMALLAEVLIQKFVK